ncbi:mannonate dehydratase [uncultured Algimonas sp.]|uniref:mannonate dehydratase n=1 Tax=uncultured Algimonas sp. TaxID=1547920 RepID=UPI0026261743|nr:mannonate dehydratase [uncultured Algimonas sp.]
MKLGMQLSRKQLNRFGVDYLAQLRQLGVVGVSLDPDVSGHDWTIEAVEKMQALADSYGLELMMMQLPLPSSPIEQAPFPNIMLGRDPERDREIDSICHILEILGICGVRTARYNLNILGIPRTRAVSGRGNSKNAAFSLKHSDTEIRTLAGRVDEDTYWERITYFLERVVPVAEANEVRLACHPHDPCTPAGFRGVDAVLGSVEGLKRFVEICPSRYHGINFCQGTIAESLENPAREIDDVIRWFGSRKKIFNVHLRNIRGGRYDFIETLPDDGDMDLLESLNIYREVGYSALIMPDHVPEITGRAPEETAFAYSLGYMSGLLHSINR